MKPKDLSWLKGLSVALGVALVGGGVAYGTLKTEAGETSRVATRNVEQIEKLEQRLILLGTGQARIDERTRRIESEQSLLRGDIKVLLGRIPVNPAPVERLR